MSQIRRSNGLSKARSAGCALGALALLISSGCKKPAAMAAPPPPTVGVVDARRMTVPILATHNGTTRALREVVVRARVRGFLTEVNFQEGAFVKKGQLLFVIDDESYKVALQSARARRTEAEAALKKAEKSKSREVAAAQLALDQAQLKLSLIDEHRSRNLLARSAGSREDLDKAESNHQRLEAQVEADRANLEQARTDYEVALLTAKAQVEAAAAAVRDAEISLGYCRMYAPIDGRIGEAKVKVGNLVGPDAGSGYTELASIQQLDPMGVDVQISSRFLARATRQVQDGLYGTLTCPGPDGDIEHPYRAECFFIDNMINSTTSTVLVKVKVENPHGTLLPGEYVNLTIEADRVKDAVVVPESSVMETEAGPVVYLLDKEGKVAIQRVKAAQAYEGLRIISSGLEAGVPIIVQGLQLVRPGSPAKAVPAVLPREVDGPKVAKTESEPAPQPKPEAKSVPAVQPGGPRSAEDPGPSASEPAGKPNVANKP